jgi:hypothetical protein
MTAPRAFRGILGARAINGGVKRGGEPDRGIARQDIR